MENDGAGEVLTGTPEVTGGGESISGKVNLNANGTPDDENATKEFIIPEKYADKDYFKDIKSVDDLFDFAANAQSVIGKRPAGIPQNDASDDEFEKFYSSMRPEKPEEYEFEKVEGVEYNEDLANKVKQILHKHGVMKRQAKGIAKEYDALMLEFAKEQGLSVQKNDTDFDKLATETFGERKEAAIANARKLLNSTVPEKFKEHVQNLDNDNLVILASVLDTVSRKYLKEGSLPIGGDKVAVEDKSERGRKLMNQRLKMNPMSKEYADITKEINQLYGTSK